MQHKPIWKTNWNSSTLYPEYMEFLQSPNWTSANSNQLNLTMNDCIEVHDIIFHTVIEPVMQIIFISLYLLQHFKLTFCFDSGVLLDIARHTAIHPWEKDVDIRVFWDDHAINPDSNEWNQSSLRDNLTSTIRHELQTYLLPCLIYLINGGIFFTVKIEWQLKLQM